MKIREKKLDVALSTMFHRFMILTLYICWSWYRRKKKEIILSNIEALWRLTKYRQEMKVWRKKILLKLIFFSGFRHNWSNNIFHHFSENPWCLHDTLFEDIMLQFLMIHKSLYCQPCQEHSLFISRMYPPDSLLWT